MAVQQNISQWASYWFVKSAGTILAVTGAAKIWAALSQTKILASSDPIVGISFGHLMLTAGLAELFVSMVCLLSRKQNISSALIAWLATCILVYRVGFSQAGWHRPCGCMGNLTDALHISPQTADTAMKIVLAYLLIGSYGILFHQWWKGRKLAVGRLEMGTPSPETRISG